MTLTNLQCLSIKSKETPFKISDSHGLYLEVVPTGSKYWRYKYRFLGKEKRLALGVYPEVSLAEAREKRNAARKVLAAGIDPSQDRKDRKRKAVINAENTFETIAREWHSQNVEKWSEVHSRNVMRRLEIDIFPYLGKRPIADISAPELLEILRKIEKRDALDVASRVKQICGQIFRYGIATGRGGRDHSADLRGTLKTRRTKSYAALDIKEIPGLLRALDQNEARLFARTRRAIRLLMLVFTRPSELVEATWDEIDLENGRWIIPAERMKMGNPHIVPLSRQAISLFKEQFEETGHMNTKWVFPSQIRPIDSMSNNTVLFALGRMGYKGKQTGHGFRALARTTLREKLGYDADVIERQLAHAVGNKIARAYDRAQFIDQREEMMQTWADYLDSIVGHGTVIVADFRKLV